MSQKPDDLDATAWEREHKKPVFDAEKNNAAPPTSPKIPVQSDFLTEETRSTAGTAQKCSPENFPQTEQLCDVTDAYPDIEADVETNPEQPNNSPANPAVPNTIYAIIRNLIAMTTTDNISGAELACPTERVRRRSRKSRNASRSKYIAVQTVVLFCYGYSLTAN